MPGGSGLLAFVFLSPFYNFLLYFFSSCSPSLPCLPSLANPPTPAHVLSMPSSSQEPNELRLQLTPSAWRPAAPLSSSQRCWLMLHLRCDGFARPKRGRKMRGNQKITCAHPLLYTLVHLYRLSVPENF